ncbi:bifunctional adenosylcobinamide kinase/adenosylcobinamide-phosphate guanylyltransferase [Ornithinimicrobium sp. Y1847]|uniref:bifunctional adenosylcobinamide kinase/adenosylcobinamide-phosphate guanylyltransferase n=1 Tax=Ornithinimicrobium sp. Y1847 TaxID=3405419 RepID=UPI003B677198
MTTTLVLGNPYSGRSRHAKALLAQHDRVSYVGTGEAQDHDLPDTWSVVRSRDLTRALLAARTAIVIDDVPEWLVGTLTEHDLWDDPETAHARLDDYLDELSLAVRAVPYDTVVLTTEPAWGLGKGPHQRLAEELLARVNQRLSAAADRVHAIVGGRVLDVTKGAAVTE